MSLFKTIEDSEIKAYFDFRDGTLIDKSGNYTITSLAGANVDNKKLELSSEVELSFGTITLGTSDFTIITKQNMKGIKNNHPLQIGANYFNSLYGTDDLSAYVNSVYYNSANTEGLDIDKSNIIATTWDRDGNMLIYINGVYKSLKDISATSSYNITGEGKIGKSSAYGICDNYYLLIVDRVLTASEVAKLTAELQNKTFNKLVSSKTKTSNMFKNHKLTNDDYWTLDTDATSGNNWSIENSVLKHNYVASTGTVISADGKTLDLKANKTYEITFDLELLDTSCRFSIYLNGTQYLSYDTYTQSGTCKFFVTPTEDCTEVRFYASQVSKSFNIINLTITEAEQRLSAEMLTDGNMESADTSSWSPDDATLSKISSTQGGGTQALRVTATGSTFWARQLLIDENKYYRVTGWAKSDGVNAPAVLCGASGDTSGWYGTTSTEWQHFDVIKKGGSASSFYLGSTGSSGYVDFNNVSLKELLPQGQNDFKTSYGITANQQAITSDFIENTPFKVVSGSFKVVDDTYNGEEVKAIECVTAGTFYMPTSYFGNLKNGAYGEWEFYLYKTAGGEINVGFANQNNTETLTAGDGYSFQWANNERIWLRSGSTSLFYSTTDYALPETIIKVNIFRKDMDGEISVYVNDTLVVPESGTNPNTNVDFKTAPYFLVEMLAGDKMYVSSKDGSVGVTKR